ncbi:hypothetical protein BD560DRAFT_427643 [Blakeslea trispora]|nr:hypothetical protein BD560DRAFT_427643 [Blakeslea trispora]
MKNIEFQDIKFTTAEFMSTVEHIISLDSGITSVLSVTAGLLQITTKIPYRKQIIIVGLAMLQVFLIVECYSPFLAFSTSFLRFRIQKLHIDVTVINETELWNTNFNSLLSCVLANPKRLVLLRLASFANIEFASTSFLSKLDHDRLYVIYEVDHLEFLSSLAQLPVFTKLENSDILPLVCYAFWKFSKKKKTWCK